MNLNMAHLRARATMADRKFRSLDNRGWKLRACVYEVLNSLRAQTYWNSDNKVMNYLISFWEIMEEVFDDHY